MHVNKRTTRERVDAWLRRHCASPWRDELAEEQYDDVHRVAMRCLKESEEDATAASPRSEPLRRLTHGKPGVGKSKVILTIVAFFEDCLGWKRGLQFHICTLQAILASALGGETCHHIAGVNPFKKFIMDDGCPEAHVATETLQVRHLMTRWLLIDECFMNSAQLKAGMESNIRGAISETSSYKICRNGERAWGGLNVLEFGDTINSIALKGCHCIRFRVNIFLTFV